MGWFRHNRSHSTRSMQGPGNFPSCRGSTASTTAMPCARSRRHRAAPWPLEEAEPRARRRLSEPADVLQSFVPRKTTSMEGCLRIAKASGFQHAWPPAGGRRPWPARIRIGLWHAVASVRRWTLDRPSQVAKPYKPRGALQPAARRSFLEHGMPVTGGRVVWYTWRGGHLEWLRLCASLAATWRFFVRSLPV